MSAGNGLFLPQRQFIQFASHPLLRSEEWLEKRAAGSWLNAALECDGRLLWNHSSSLRGTGCWQERAHVLYRALIASSVLSQSTGATTSYCMHTTRKPRAPENAWALPQCATLHPRWALTLGWGPWAVMRRPYNFPSKHQATSLPTNRPSHPSIVKRQHRAQSAEAGHQWPFVCAVLSRNKRHASNPLSSRLHLNVRFPGWNSCPSIDSSWRNEVEINHVAILSSFPTAFQVSPGISFPCEKKKKKRAEAELEEFLISSCFPNLKPGQSYRRPQKPICIHGTCTETTANMHAASLTLSGGISVPASLQSPFTHS